MFTSEQFVANLGSVPEGGFMVDGGDAIRFDPGLMRPYRGEDGKIYVDVTTGYSPSRKADGTLITNASGEQVYGPILEPQLVHERMYQGLPVANVNNALVLRKDQWIALDARVGQAARSRLRAYQDLLNANSYGGFDAMATTILENEIINDPGEAIVDMDGISEGRSFQPTYGLQGTPLPCTHSGFYLSSRFLAQTRARGGQPANTVRAAIAGRRVGETIERMTIGSVGAYTYGESSSAGYEFTSKVYGYLTHPDRITHTGIVASGSFNGVTFVNDVIAAREKMYSYNFFGPFMLYVGGQYDAKLDADYIPTGGDSTMGTVRQRLRQIDGITDVRRLDYLGGDTFILVQMTEDVVQAVNGMAVTTVQWETKGGFQLNFKVLAIQVPRFFSVNVTGTAQPGAAGYNLGRKTGILVATVA